MASLRQVKSGMRFGQARLTSFGFWRRLQTANGAASRCMPGLATVQTDCNPALERRRSPLFSKVADRAPTSENQNGRNRRRRLVLRLSYGGVE